MTAHLDHLGSPSSLQRSSLFQFFHWLWGWVHFQVEDGEGGERKKKRKRKKQKIGKIETKETMQKPRQDFFKKDACIVF